MEVVWLGIFVCWPTPHPFPPHAPTAAPRPNQAVNNDAPAHPRQVGVLAGVRELGHSGAPAVIRLPPLQLRHHVLQGGQPRARRVPAGGGRERQEKSGSQLELRNGRRAGCGSGDVQGRCSPVRTIPTAGPPARCPARQSSQSPPGRPKSSCSALHHGNGRQAAAAGGAAGGARVAAGLCSGAPPSASPSARAALPAHPERCSRASGR